MIDIFFAELFYTKNMFVSETVLCIQKITSHKIVVELMNDIRKSAPADRGHSVQG